VSGTKESDTHGHLGDQPVRLLNGLCVGTGCSAETHVAFGV